MSHLKLTTIVVSLLSVFSMACSKEGAPKTALPKSELPEKYLVTSAPRDAKGVHAIRSEAKEGDKVAVAGRAKDFIDGFAVFTITDESLKPCDEAGPMPDCDTPWDYCCDDPTEVANATVTVEFRDGATPLKKSVRGFHGLDHLTHVVVTGKAHKDEAGNLSVLADGLYVRP